MPVAVALPDPREVDDYAASAIWDASIVKVILVGASASKDLQELSVLIGERNELTDQHHEHRALRLSLAPTLDATRPDHAARVHPNDALRDWTCPSA